MKLTRTTHRTDKVMRVDVRFDTTATGLQQLVNYRVYLSGASKLKNHRITGITVRPSYYVRQANVVDVVSLADFVLTLCNNQGKPILSQYPLVDLIAVSVFSDKAYSRRVNFRFDPDQSYVQLLNTSYGARTRDEIIPLFFWYTN